MSTSIPIDNSTTDPVTAVPSYQELLQRTDAPPGSSWGVFGEGDQLGALNFITPDVTLQSSRLVREGRIFNLDYPINAFVPSIAGTRPPTEHHLFSNNPNHRDDWLDAFYLQSTSQIDGLRHMRHPEYGFYGGVPDEAIEADSPALGIQLLAEAGIAGRGVLIDLPRYYASIGRSYDVATNHMVTVDDIVAAAARQSVEFRSGDVLLLDTGWAQDYLALSADEQAYRRAHWGSPGIEQSGEMLEFLWDSHFSLVASDNAGVEAFPVKLDSGFVDPNEVLPDRGPSHNGMLHRPLLALLGIYLGELWKLDELAEACAQDGSYEVFLTSKALNVVGGVGTPPNAMAIK